jgi:hypothetical protein
MPETLYKNTVYMAAPVLVIDQVIDACATVTGLPLSHFRMAARLSPNGAEPTTMRLSAGVYTDLQLAALKPLFAAGGVLHLLGARARRGINEATETTTGEADKLNVTVHDVGDSSYNDVDWTVVRLTLGRFLEELGPSGLKRVVDAI